MRRSPFSWETRRSTEVCTTNNICQGTYEINVHREWWYGPITSWIKDVVYWNSDTIDMYNIILMEVQWVKKYTSGIRGTDVMTYLKENIGKYNQEYPCQWQWRIQEMSTCILWNILQDIYMHMQYISKLREEVWHLRIR